MLDPQTLLTVVAPAHSLGAGTTVVFELGPAPSAVVQALLAVLHSIPGDRLRLSPSMRKWWRACQPRLAVELALAHVVVQAGAPAPKPKKPPKRLRWWCGTCRRRTWHAVLQHRYRCERCAAYKAAAEQGRWREAVAAVVAALPAPADPW